MHQRAILKSEGSEMDNKKCGLISYRWVEVEIYQWATFHCTAILNFLRHKQENKIKQNLEDAQLTVKKIL